MDPRFIGVINQQASARESARSATYSFVSRNYRGKRLNSAYIPIALYGLGASEVRSVSQRLAMRKIP